jgi:septum formation protein
MLPTILLASASPRRRDTLRALGFPLHAEAMDIDESVADALPVRERVRRLAELKAAAAHGKAWSGNGPKPRWILGADTLVSLDGLVFAKAEDRAEAGRMLNALAGQTHQVYSGLALIDGYTGAVHSMVSTTDVRFAPLSGQEIEAYLATDEWQGVAGAYRIQERASFFVERIEGSFSGVVGLPLREFYVILRQAAYPL